MEHHVELAMGAVEGTGTPLLSHPTAPLPKDPPGQKAENLLKTLAGNHFSVVKIGEKGQWERLLGMKRASNASRGRYADLYDFAPIAFITLSRNGLIEEMNQTASTLLGVEWGEGKGLPLLSYIAVEDRGAFMQYLRTCRAEGNGSQEFRLKPRGGSPLQVQIRTKASQRPDGRTWYPTTITDLTELRQSEAERARLSEISRHACADNDAKDRFLAVLSHELRSPLTPALAVVTSDELWDAVPESLHSLLETARRNLEVEKQLIDDLLDISRIRMSKLRLQTEPLNVHDVLRETVEMWQEELVERDLNLTTEFSASRFIVSADAVRLRQIFWNLLKNAMKFTPRGGRIMVGTHNPTTGAITISVSDNGAGFEKEMGERLFDPFEQGQGPDRSGLGLGLSIVRGLVEAHGGRVVAESPGPGQGASFQITLPITTDAPVIAPVVVDDPKLPEAIESTGRLRILLVEDHADTARVMARILRHRGYEVAMADGVARALELASVERFDLLVSDLGLPDGNGMDLLKQIQAGHGPIRAIALSGFASQEDIRRCREAGFAEHLAKPVEISRLLGAIGHVTGNLGN
jgi:PAS domain S-box-containing protein